MTIDNMDGSALPNDGTGDVAIIGEGTPNRTPISLQVLQSIYHELTGRTEQVTKSYEEPLKIVQCDLEQLNARIQQALEQYNVKAETSEFIVFYQNDTNDRFSSFERFKSFNAGCSSAVESVLFKYNFMLLLPKTNQPQGYTLTIRIVSQVVLEKKMRRHLFELPKIIRLMGGRTAVVTIDYIDYMVARNLLDIVDGWFQTLSKSRVSSTIDFIRKRSSYIPLISRYTVGAFVVFLIYQAIPILLPTTSTLTQFAYFSLIAFSGLFTAYKLAGHLGSAAEDAIDRWNPISYVQLTAGDKKQIEEIETDNKKTIFLALLNLMGSFIVAVSARIVANILTST